MPFNFAGDLTPRQQKALRGHPPATATRIERGMRKANTARAWSDARAAIRGDLDMPDEQADALIAVLLRAP